MAGFSMRLVAYAPSGARLGILPQPLEVTVSFVFNDLGILKVKYSKHAIGGSLLDRDLSAGIEIAIELANHSNTWFEPPGGRFWARDEDVNIADDADIVQLTAPGIAGLLVHAQMFNLGALLGKGHSQAGKRPFYSTSAGIVLATLMQENADRQGVCTVLTRGFTTAKDSGNANWSQAVNLYLEADRNIWYWLQNLTDQGLCDWRTAGRQLNVYNPHTVMATDLANTVRLRLGKELGDAPATSTIADLASTILVRGDNGLVITEHNPSAPTPWARFEATMTATGVDSESRARTVAQADLERRAKTTTQYTRELMLENSSLWPLVDYQPGDWITAPTNVPAERVRVQQVTLTANERGEVSGSLVLNDRLLDAEIKRARKFAGIAGAAGGGTGTLPLPPGADDRTPAAPQNLLLSTDAYLDNSGVQRGTVTATWTVVDYATDGTAMEILGYDVEYKTGNAGWAPAGISLESNVHSYGPLQCGTTVQFRVRARASITGNPGVWSAVKSIVVAADTTPPPPPSTFTVATNLGVVTILWDGKTNQNGAMPLDFDKVLVYQEGVTAPVGVIRDVPGSHVIAGLTPGEQIRFRGTAVDRAGNESPTGSWSAFVTPQRIVPTDLDAALKQLIEDTDGAARIANEEIAKKPSVFPTQPWTPYKVGDLWLHDSGVIYFCTTGKATGSFNAAHWVSTAGAAGQSAVVGVLSNEAHTLAADNAGAVGSFTGADTTLSIYVGASDDSANWTVAATASGLTGTLSGRTYTVTAMAGDTGYVDLTATRAGFADVTKRFTVTKSKQGTGGANAKHAAIVATGALFASTDGTAYTPTTIALSPTLQNVNFVRWQYSTNGGTSWSNITNQNGLTVSGEVLTVASASTLFNNSVTAISFKLVTSDSTITDTHTVVRVKDGADGSNGVTLYTWIKYADSPTSGMNDSPTGKSYLGVAYNKTTSTESNNYSDYTWTKIKGEDGLPGIGINGTTTYTWVRYAPNGAPTNNQMTQAPNANTTHIGFAFNKLTATESNTAADYTWQLVKGADGLPGASVQMLYARDLVDAKWYPGTIPNAGFAMNLANPAAGLTGPTDSNLQAISDYLIYDGNQLIVLAGGLDSPAAVQAQVGFWDSNGTFLSQTTISASNCQRFTIGSTGSTVVAPVGAAYVRVRQRGLHGVDGAWLVVLAGIADTAFAATTHVGYTTNPTAPASAYAWQRTKGADGEMGTAIWLTSTPTSATPGKPGWTAYVIAGSVIQSTWRCTAGTGITTGNTWTQVTDKAVTDAATVASAAQTSANGKTKISYATAAPTDTNPGRPGDLWWVRNSSGTITAQYLCTAGTGENTGNSWTLQPISNDIIANLDIGKLTAGSASIVDAVAQKIWADIVNANTITANTLVAGALHGYVITLNANGVIQTTAETDRGIKIRNTGIRAYNSSGVETFSLNAQGAGVITGATIRTAASGARVEMNNSNFTAYNAAGTATVTISGTGASIKAGTIEGVNITGSTLTGGTVTGATIQTSGSSNVARAVLTNTSANSMPFITFSATGDIWNGQRSTMDTGAVTFYNSANAVTARMNAGGVYSKGGTIEGGTLTGGKIYGAEVATSSSNSTPRIGMFLTSNNSPFMVATNSGDYWSGQRLSISPNGISMQNSAGTTVGQFDASGLTAVGGTITGATIRTAASGARIALNTSGISAYNSNGVEHSYIRPTEAHFDSDYVTIKDRLYANPNGISLVNSGNSGNYPRVDVGSLFASLHASSTCYISVGSTGPVLHYSTTTYISAQSSGLQMMHNGNNVINKINSIINMLNLVKPTSMATISTL